MKTITYTAIRAKLARKMLEVCEDHIPYLITRTRADPVVMISLDDYESMLETFYLLKSPGNVARLSEAIDEVEAMIEKQEKQKKQKARKRRK
jgi:antitoxin YefM